MQRASRRCRGSGACRAARLRPARRSSQRIQREVLEETGLVSWRSDPIVEVLDRIHTDGDGRVEYHYVLIDYAARLSAAACTRSPTPPTRAGRCRQNCPVTRLRPQHAPSFRQALDRGPLAGRCASQKRPDLAHCQRNPLFRFLPRVTCSLPLFGCEHRQIEPCVDWCNGHAGARAGSNRGLASARTEIR